MEFLAMGGHGWYVFSAYGLSAVVLIAVGVLPLLRLRQRVRALRQRASAEAA